MEPGLIAKLKRTKDNGSREGVWSPASFHHKKRNCVVDPTWMQKDYELWCSSVADKNRDFFVFATADCKEFSEKYASARDLAGMGMRMLMELVVPEKKDNMWCSTGEKMLNGISAAGFAGHSERATMPSILAALGVSKADRDMMGRWRVGAD